jgi:apolipoprotein N-acyltransferase
MITAQHRFLPRRLSALAPAIAIGGWLGAFLVPLFARGNVLVAFAIPVAIGGLAYLFNRGTRAFHEETGYRWLVLEGVAGWVGLEMARSLVPAIGTWAFVGYTQWRSLPLIQPVSVFGIYGLNLVIMLVNYTLAAGLIYLIDSRPHRALGTGRDTGADEGATAATATAPTTTAAALAHHGCLSPVSMPREVATKWARIAVCTLVAWCILGTVQYQVASNRLSAPEVQHVRVAAIQPNLPRAAHVDKETTSEHRLMLLSPLTRKAASQGARVIVWPEMALGFDPRVEHKQEIQSLALATRATLVIGYVVRDDEGFRNEAVVVSPWGEFLGVYGKKRPMITSGEPPSVTPRTYPVFITPSGRLAAIICFDAHFTDAARRMGRQGAQIIAVPSLFGSSIAHLPHTQAVFRAVENGAAVIMADVAFSSAIISPIGKVLERTETPAGSWGTLIASVPILSSRTVYSYLGDWLGWLSLAGLICFAVAVPSTAKRAARRVIQQQTPAPPPQPPPQPPPG